MLNTRNRLNAMGAHRALIESMIAHSNVTTSLSFVNGVDIASAVNFNIAKSVAFNDSLSRTTQLLLLRQDDRYYRKFLQRVVDTNLSDVPTIELLRMHSIYETYSYLRDIGDGADKSVSRSKFNIKAHVDYYNNTLGIDKPLPEFETISADNAKKYASQVYGAMMQYCLDSYSDYFIHTQHNIPSFFSESYFPVNGEFVDSDDQRVLDVDVAVSKLESHTRNLYIDSNDSYAEFIGRWDRFDATLVFFVPTGFHESRPEDYANVVAYCKDRLQGDIILAVDPEDAKHWSMGWASEELDVMSDDSSWTKECFILSPKISKISRQTNLFDNTMHDVIDVRLSTSEDSLCL